MARDLRLYDSGLQYGAKVTAVDTSQNLYYIVSAVGTAGPTSVNVFGNSGTTTLLTAGTVTGFWCIASAVAGGSAGTYSLLGTTAGTIATIAVTSTAFSNGSIAVVTGTVMGTSVLNAAVPANDSLTVTGVGGGTATAFVSFITSG